MQREVEESGGPEKVDGDSQGGGDEGIERGTGHEDGKGSLRHEEMLEGARVAGFLQAVVKRVHRGVEVVEEDETNQGKGEVAAGLRESLAELGAINEASDVIESGGAEESFNCFDYD